MITESVSIAQGHVPQSAAQTWDVHSRVSVTPPLYFFRRVLCLRLPTGGAADGIAIDAGGTTLTGQFLHYDYDALDPAEPSLAASLSQAGSTTVIVQLDAPRQVRQVRFATSLTLTGMHTLEFYRIDGHSLTENPTTSATVVTRLATLGADFTDARCAIRLKRPDGSYVSFTTSQVSELWLRTYPTSPRIGVARPEGLNEAVFFFQKPGEFGKTAEPPLPTIEDGAKLATALQRSFDDLAGEVQANAAPGTPVHLPAQIDVALIIASDAPCRLDIASLHLAYHLVSETFPGQEEKQVLRFQGGRVVTQEAMLELPGGVTVFAASLKAVESLRSDRVTGHSEEPPSLTTILEKAGVYVGVDRWAAQSVTPAQAMSASGITLGLMGLGRRTEITLELQDDFQGRPSGRRLAGGTIAVPRIGRPEWVTLAFREHVVLPSQPHWVLLKASRGRAVWLAHEGGEPVRVLMISPASGATTVISVLDNLQALLVFFSRSRQAQEHGQPPLSLTVGNEGVTGTADPEARGTRLYDLASALNAYLADKPGGTLVRVPLTFAASVPGILMVYPPRVEYDIGR